MNKLGNFPKLLRPILFVLATILMAGSVRAEWVQLGRTDTFRIYLDQKLIQKDGDLAQVLQLMDFTVAQWADERTAVGSIKNLVEYDCGQPRSRTLSGEAFSEQMGAGRLVASEKLVTPEWEEVASGGTAEQIRKLACGKK